MAHALRDTVNERASELTARVYAEAAPRVERVTEVVTDTAAPVVADAVATLQEALDTAAERGGAAWVALRGGPVGPPIAARRWTWAVGAAVLGAAAGAGAAVLVSRLLLGRDAPGAQDPADLEAVVDRDVDRPVEPPPAG